jgi:GGDEF domain-containing protein
MEKSSELITDAINNKLQKDTLKYNYKYHDYKYSINKNGIEELIIIPIQSKNYDYLVAINSKKENKLNDKFMPIFKDVLTIILDKYDYITKLKESAVIDTLTGLYNRNIYEIDTRKTNDTEGIVYGLFDLLRLKNINDDYSHSHGDLYISKAAKILSNYFPSYHLIIDEKGKVKKIESGNRLYRIGGDEFALISKTESYDSAKIKIMIIQDEVKNMDLGIDEPLGINYGLVKAKNGNTFRDLYLESDALLSENKIEQYQQLGLERRK